MRAGDVVLDVGCGTGLRFDLLQQRVGPSGKIVGVRRLASHAGSGPARVADQGWDNVVLIEPLVEDAVLGDRIDHVLFGAVHDVRQSPIKEIEMGCGYGFPAEPRQHFRRTAALPTHRRVTHLPEVRRAGTLMVQVGGAAPSCPGIRR